MSQDVAAGAARATWHLLRIKGATGASRSRSPPTPNKPQEQTGGLYRGSALARLALLGSMCQRRSEDFVPPAAQRRLVSRARENRRISLARAPREENQPWPTLLLRFRATRGQIVVF